jgi:hypothetical protein
VQLRVGSDAVDERAKQRPCLEHVDRLLILEEHRRDVRELRSDLLEGRDGGLAHHRHQQIAERRVLSDAVSRSAG